MWRKFCRKGRDIFSGDYPWKIFLIASTDQRYIELLVPVSYFLTISEFLTYESQRKSVGNSQCKETNSMGLGFQIWKWMLKCVQWVAAYSCVYKVILHDDRCFGHLM